MVECNVALCEYPRWWDELERIRPHIYSIGPEIRLLRQHTALELEGVSYYPAADACMYCE